MTDGPDRGDLSSRIASLSPEKRALLERSLMLQQTRVAKDGEIPRRGDPGPWPLSFAQQRLWFLDQMAPDSRAYNMPKGVRISGPLDVEVLQSSLNAIVDRHQVLRTVFASSDDSPVQVVSQPRPVEMPFTNLSDWSEAEREAEVQRRLLEVTLRPFDLSRDLMLRAALFRMGKAEHILLLVTHHIASDGWSTNLLLQDLAAFCHCFSTGEPSPLPEMPIQYADFSQWQHERLQGPVLESHLAYWKEQLGGALPPVELPTDRPRPRIQTYVGARELFEIPPAISHSLHELSRQEGVTLFMTLLAAFQTLLHRYSRQDKIVVGVPIAGRTRVETEGLIGFFVNTLVLRNDLSGDPSFRELLSRVREVALGAYAHQDLPFEKLVAELQPERDLSRNPLFQVAFAMQNTPRAPLIVKGELTFTSFDVDKGSTPFDLTLNLHETGRQISGRLEYNTDLFDHDTIARLVGHFQTLLESVVDNPDQLVSDLPLLTEGERYQLLVEWNDTQADCPQDWCVHQLFEAQVERTPGAVAVVFEEEQLTYRELNRRANQLAHHLRALGVGPEVLVGICVERSLEMVVGLLGILKAGGGYVPLDPAYPKERLAFMLEDTQVQVLLTQQRLLESLPKHNVRSLGLDSDWEVVAQESNENPVSGVTAENLAYVIYTSGSTGSPKGVMVTHSNVVRLFRSTESWCQFNGADVWTLFHSFAFDFSVWEIWGALLYGGTLVIVPHWVSRSPEDFYQLLIRERVTILNQTPSAFQQLMPVDESYSGDSLLALRMVIFGGEALEILSLRPWLDRRGDSNPQLVNMYGITESTVHGTYQPITLSSLNTSGSLIGRPLSDLQVYILDQHLNPVPVGVPGEICLGGSGLARGYLNRPNLTAEKFIPNPFSDDPGARIYLTGDLASYRQDGRIRFLGRIDDQVKIRGFRVEPGEIEATLAEHSLLREAVVVAREDTSGNNRLVAYLVPEVDRTPSVSELRSFLKEKLPEYMVPSAYVFLDSLPLTPNGKIDRLALPAPDQARPELDGAFAEPETPIQLVVAQAWREALGVDQVGLYDNFFDLGGHSLMAMQVIAKLEKSTGLRISPMEFMFQTMGQLAASCEARMQVQPPAGPPRRLRRLLSTMKHLIFHRDGVHSESVGWNGGKSTIC